MSSTSSSFRGFAALIPVLISAVTLVSFAMLVSKDAYALRFSVMRAEQKSTALAAAHSCASSVLLRIAQTPTESIEPELVRLNQDRTCRVDKVDHHSDHYEIVTSASVGEIVVRVVTDAFTEDGTILRTSSREI